MHLPNLKPWQPGQSGNPSGLPGRTKGSRNLFSEGYIRDFSLVWQEQGVAAIRKVATKRPEAFLAIASKLIPSDVQLSIEQTHPSLSPEDIVVLKAIRQAIPRADLMSPEQVTQHVLDAVQSYESKVILALPKPEKSAL